MQLAPPSLKVFITVYCSTELPFISRATMTSTPNTSLPARSQGHHATTQHTPTPEFLRLLDFLQEEGPVRSSRSPSVAVPAPAAHEGLNTTAGSEHNVSCETRSRASAHLGPSGETGTALTAPRLFQGQDRVSTNPTIDRVSRFEELNDVTGRVLRSFRKSPCPPRRRSSSTAHDSE